MGISILVFDLGGVLLPFNQERRIRAMMNAFGLADADVVRFLTSGIAQELDCGACDLETSAARMSAFTGQPVSVVQAKELWLSVFEAPNMPLWDLVAQLRGHTRTFALSDNPSFVKDVFPRKDAFDRVFWSAELGMTKPARSLFEKVRQETKTTPANIVFIDDSIANVEAAKGCGWDAILFSSNRQLLNDLALRGFQT